MGWERALDTWAPTVPYMGCHPLKFGKTSKFQSPTVLHLVCHFCKVAIESPPRVKMRARISIAIERRGSRRVDGARRTFPSRVKRTVRGQRLGGSGEREDEHVGDERAGQSGECAEDGRGRVEAPRGEGVELRAEERVEAAAGGEAGQEERVETERERRAEVGARPPREGDEARERGRRGGAEEEVEDAVRGGGRWHAAARERHHAIEAARREVRQQR